jgi:dGTPase
VHTPELAAYAVSAINSRGRNYPDAQPSHRSDFQRDRDRIVHSTAFRRLEYKTQVFVNHEGDLFRTRLTHSLEVAQIARGIARALRLNEDLAEAISLAHDLGHTPFGHAGQEALNNCMHAHGGFEHNQQSLTGTRYGERFLNRTQPSLEAQICNLADEIAYNNHDVDDGLRAGLITLEQLAEVGLFAQHVAAVRALYPGLGGRRLIHETIRRMINALVCDLIETTASNIARHQPRDVAAVRLAPPLVAFSDDLRQAQRHMKRFLRTHLYQHYQVLRMASKAQRIIADLFVAFTANPRLLPPQYQLPAEGDQVRRVADYIAGMTDRYAIKEHRRLFAIGES